MIKETNVTKCWRVTSKQSGKHPFAGWNTQQFYNTTTIIKYKTTYNYAFEAYWDEISAALGVKNLRWHGTNIILKHHHVIIEQLYNSLCDV